MPEDELHATPYARMGGAETVRSLAHRFYFLVDNDPQYRDLRALHPGSLEPVQESLAGWLSAWTGGPRDWFDTHPGVCMMSMHRSMGISRRIARQWTDAMRRAIDADPAIDAELGAQLGDALSRMAGAMVTHAEPLAAA
ncbi:MAG: globin [Pseudomonadota bacterium]